VSKSKRPARLERLPQQYFTALLARVAAEQGGRAVIPADYAQQLRRAMTDIAGKTNVRLRFIGYTRNERLDRRTASV
jgi:hypothetical protein